MLLEVTANGIVMRKASVPKNTKGLFETSLKKSPIMKECSKIM
jgi:hypothetical protein